MYISDDSENYEETNIMPNSGYVINDEKSFCYIGNKDNIDRDAKLYTNSNGEHIISNLIKGDKCILYFDKTFTMEERLANYYTNKSERNTFNESFVTTTSNTVFTASDDDGTSYYFGGNPTDNWVKFGGYYWRIIRINGDGSIRMIYQGIEPNATGEGTQIGASAFNSDYNDNMYVGYFYTSNQLRGLGTASTIYTALNNWFANSNIKQGSAYFDKIDSNAGFCGDRTPSSTNTPTVSNGLNTGDGKGGTGTITTYYGAYLRLAPGGNAVTSSTTTVTPSLNCPDSSDLYTYSGASQGNKKLANPVGLITADEVAYGGLVFATAPSARTNYLDTGQSYWTLSPSVYGHAGVFLVNSIGRLSNLAVNNAYDVRPVINIRSDIKLTGLGTIDNPYKVS
ncbi:MAG: hypothetical protein NC483_07150 [Ruminococcus sp.]|nr:hypothetical protein [Ruminococcus sp.]